LNNTGAGSAGRNQNSAEIKIVGKERRYYQVRASS
jgi:hypothetical protein